MIRSRRSIEEFSISFLDVICCGFGAVILLLMISQNQLPIVLSQTIANDQLSIENKETKLEQVIETIGITKNSIEMTKVELSNLEADLTKTLDRLNTIRAKYETQQEISEEIENQNLELAEAKQSLTEEMEDLLGADFRSKNKLAGGIPVDSEYIIFVIDSSGSMHFDGNWGNVVRLVRGVLSEYPSIKAFQVLDDDGNYLFSSYRRKWIQDSPSTRTSIINALAGYRNATNSSPVEGIQEAIGAYYDPNKKIAIWYLGDDFAQNISIEEIVDDIDRINVVDEFGERRVRIHTIAFLTFGKQIGFNERIQRFANFMRELAYRNDGTFIAL